MVHAVGGACAVRHWEDREGDAGHDDEQLTQIAQQPSRVSTWATCRHLKSKCVGVSDRPGRGRGARLTTPDVLMEYGCTT